MIEKTCKLDENMLPIKYFIYINQRLKNLQRYRELQKINVSCYGVQTDLLLVNATDEQTLREHFNLDDKIGGLKIEHGKVIRGKTIEFNKLDDIDNARIKNNH